LARSSERGCCAVSTAAIPPIGGSRVECPANKFDTLPFRSCELVVVVGDVVGVGVEGSVLVCAGVAHLGCGVFDCEGEEVPGSRATESCDPTTTLDYPLARFGPFQ